MDGLTMRNIRREKGIPIAALARAIGVAPSSVSAYERGANPPARAVVERMTAALAAGAESPVYRHGLVTVPAAATAIWSGLRHSWPTADLLRIVRELRSNAKHLVSAEDRALFYAEPSTTGDRRWDALLAGVTEMDALRTGTPVPPWARGHELPHLWFVGSQPSTYAYALVRTPSSLAVRGIVLDGASLESV